VSEQREQEGELEVGSDGDEADSQRDGSTVGGVTGAFWRGTEPDRGANGSRTGMGCADRATSVLSGDGATSGGDVRPLGYNAGKGYVVQGGLLRACSKYPPLFLFCFPDVTARRADRAEREYVAGRSAEVRTQDVGLLKSVRRSMSKLWIAKERNHSGSQQKLHVDER